MKFWREWAERAPALVRAGIEQVEYQAIQPYTPLKTALAAVGCLLGVASFTKYVPGKWKWISGLGSAGSLMGAVSIGSKNVLETHFLNDYANCLEGDPALRKELAQYLSDHVTSDSIQSLGIEKVVAVNAMAFIKDMLTKQAIYNSMQRSIATGMVCAR